VVVPDRHKEAIKMNGGVGADIVLRNRGTSSVVKIMKASRRGGTVSLVEYLSQQDVSNMRELLPVLVHRKIALR
jgi:NADPH:quinone reductase-like Zn-dependent oxidoreductase